MKQTYVDFHSQERIIKSCGYWYSSFVKKESEAKMLLRGRVCKPVRCLHFSPA